MVCLRKMSVRPASRACVGFCWGWLLASAGWHTADVVFVADDLGAWLVGLLADAGSKRLFTAVLGDEQERALRKAATAAVEATAAEVSSSSGEQADRIAMGVNKVFRKP